MNLSEFWEGYHTAITLISGCMLFFALFISQWPRRTSLKVLIFVAALLLLTGLLGLIKFAVLAIAVLGLFHFSWFALWAYGIILLVVLNRTYGWELEVWQIFLITGAWYPVSLLLSTPLLILNMYISAILARRKKPIAEKDN